MAISTAHAADRDEASAGDLSGNGLAPTTLLLDHAARPGGTGYNVVTGTTGRAAAGASVDRDYLHVVVPAGYLWTELRVGNQTTTGGAGGSFIGLAAGASTNVSPSATNAAGLLGWRHYTTADRNTDILDDMAVANNGSAGFMRPLEAGDYTLWIQELATGSFTYRFNLVLTPVPEAGTLPLMWAGLISWIGFAARRVLWRSGVAWRAALAMRRA